MLLLFRRDTLQPVALVGLLMFLCFLGNKVAAQDQVTRPGAEVAPKAMDNCPYCQISPGDRHSIVCDARSTAYEKDKCSERCTDECRQIGAALKECDPAKLIACTQ
jgi:hypothetical protein